MKKNTPHLKSPKNQKKRAALGRPAMKLLAGVGGGASTSLRSTLSSALVPQTLSCLVNSD